MTFYSFIFTQNTHRTNENINKYIYMYTHYINPSLLEPSSFHALWFGKRLSIHAFVFTVSSFAVTNHIYMMIVTNQSFRPIKFFSDWNFMVLCIRKELNKSKICCFLYVTVLLVFSETIYLWRHKLLPGSCRFTTCENTTLFFESHRAKKNRTRLAISNENE